MFYIPYSILCLLVNGRHACIHTCIVVDNLGVKFLFYLTTQEAFYRKIDKFEGCIISPETQEQHGVKFIDLYLFAYVTKNNKKGIGCNKTK